MVEAGSESSAAAVDPVAAKPAVKKSRFSSNISNVVEEQNRFKQEQQHKQVKPEPKSHQIAVEDMDVDKKPAAETSSDTVYDIKKWPEALKAYCAKVYKHYSSVSQVSEDQVTKYLQKRITDVFKVTPDLNTGWEHEPIPEIYDIKQVTYTPVFSRVRDVW